MELYSPSHPAACDSRDICAWELVRERVRKNGMLLVSKDVPPPKPKFLPETDQAEIVCEKHTVCFRTPNGKRKKQDIWFGYLPPR